MPVVLPKWGMNMVEATVLKWLKAEGDAVEPGDDLAEVETDKVDGIVEAPVAGLLKAILVPEGDDVEVGAVMAIIQTS